MKNPATIELHGEYRLRQSNQNHAMYRRLEEALRELGLSHHDKEVFLSTHYSAENHQ